MYLTMFIFLQKGISEETVTVVDSRIECTFTRQAASDDNDVNYYDLGGNNEYTVIMARSSIGLNDGKWIFTDISLITHSIKVKLVC